MITTYCCGNWVIEGSEYVVVGEAYVYACALTGEVVGGGPRVITAEVAGGKTDVLTGKVVGDNVCILTGEVCIGVTAEVGGMELTGLKFDCRFMVIGIAKAMILGVPPLPMLSLFFLPGDASTHSVPFFPGGERGGVVRGGPSELSAKDNYDSDGKF